MSHSELFSFTAIFPLNIFSEFNFIVTDGQ